MGGGSGGKLSVDKSDKVQEKRGRVAFGGRMTAKAVMGGKGYREELGLVTIDW